MIRVTFEYHEDDIPDRYIRFAMRKASILMATPSPRRRYVEVRPQNIRIDRFPNIGWSLPNQAKREGH